MEGEVEVTRAITKFVPRVNTDKHSPASPMKIRFMDESILNANRDKVAKQTEITIARLSSGSMIGEEDLVSNRPYSVTARSVSTHTLAFCMKREDFAQWITKDSKVMSLVRTVALHKDKELIKKIKQFIVGSESEQQTSLTQIQNENPVESVAVNPKLKD